jgi:signal transduction histidine kinase
MSEATRLEQILVNTDKTSFPITELIRSCFSGYQIIYPDISFSLNINLALGNTSESDNEASIKMYGSPEHIVQLLDKVINNAVEFSNDKVISVCVTQTAQVLSIKISNHGIHLPKVMLSSLFDSMVSVRSHSKQSQPHLGLGLYIARLICHFHQGEIKAENNFEPDGVSISISLPLTH